MEKDKIEVGEYIRTKSGIIGKVKYISESYNFRTTTGHIARGQEKYIIDNKKQRGYISKPYVIKHSKNIIDLIEVGDIAIVKNGLGEEELIFIDNENKKCIVRTHKIKSIVTHEQMKEMEYRV